MVVSVALSAHDSLHGTDFLTAARQTSPARRRLQAPFGIPRVGSISTSQGACSHHLRVEQSIAPPHARPPVRRLASFALGGTNPAPLDDISNSAWLLSLRWHPIIPSCLQLSRASSSGGSARPPSPVPAVDRLLGLRPTRSKYTTY